MEKGRKQKYDAFFIEFNYCLGQAYFLLLVVVGLVYLDLLIRITKNAITTLFILFPSLLLLRLLPRSLQQGHWSLENSCVLRCLGQGSKRIKRGLPVRIVEISVTGVLPKLLFLICQTASSTLTHSSGYLPWKKDVFAQELSRFADFGGCANLGRKWRFM